MYLYAHINTYEIPKVKLKMLFMQHVNESQILVRECIRAFHDKYFISITKFPFN